MNHYVQFNDAGEYKKFGSKKKAHIFIDKEIKKLGGGMWSLYSEKELRDLFTQIGSALLGHKVSISETNTLIVG